MRSLMPVLLILALVAGWLALGMAPASAQSPFVLDGRVTNGTPGGEVPLGLQISLTVLDGDNPLQELTTTIDDGGSFQFSDVPSGPEMRYVVSTEYQGAFYQSEADLSGGAPLELTIYESTIEQSILTLLDDTIMITPDDQGVGVLLIREVARLRNSQQLTFIPSFDQGDMGGMTFLRFSLPFGYQNLTISSDLVGGQVIPVDRGVGLTAPVPPGIHAMVLTYTLPYEGTDLVYEPSFSLGVEVLRILMREDVGTVLGSGLEEIEPVSVGGNTFRVFQVSDLTPRERITLGFSDLPQDPWTQRAWDAIRSQWELSLVIPGVAGLLLLALLVYAWRLRLKKPEFVAPSALLQNIRRQPAQRGWLEAIARLDESFKQGTIAKEEYIAQREELKRTLLGLAIKDARYL